MPIRGGVVVTSTQPPAGVGSELPSTVGTLPVFTVGGNQPKIADSVFRQADSGNKILIGITTGTNGSVAADSAIVIGKNALGRGPRVIAIGQNAGQSGGLVPGADSIMIGTGAETIGANSIIIGTAAGLPSMLPNLICIGQLASAAQDGVAIGRGAATDYSYGAKEGIAIGREALVNEGIAIGPGARCQGLYLGNFGIAIGRSATTTVNNELVFGHVTASPVAIVTVSAAAGAPVRHRTSAAGWAIRNLANTADILKVDESAVADDVRLLLWDVTAGTLKHVTRGAVDSGGVGFRALRIAN